MSQGAKFVKGPSAVAGISPVDSRMAPRVKLMPNIKRIIEAVCYIIAEAERRSRRVTQYDILKTLFLADKSHLNKYGRPITFDNYYAMKHGPVATVAYNLLKDNRRTLAKYDLHKLPWEKSNPEKGSGRHYYSGAKSEVDEDILSQSDVAALSDALTTIKSLTYPQIRRLTHNDTAYIEAWKDDDEKKAFLMSYGMLFDLPNYEEAATIEFLSKHQ